MDKDSRQHTIKYSGPSLGITILGCGWSYRNYNSPIQKRNWIRSNNLLVFFLEGKGKLESAGTGLVEIRPGNMFVVPKNVWHRYGPEVEDEWFEFWISFEGRSVKSLFRQMTDGRYHMDKCNLFHIQIDENLLDLLKTFFVQASEDNYMKCTTLFFELMQILEANQKNHKHRIESKYITSIVEMINEDPIININFEEEAAKLGISYVLLRKEFLKYTGLPPYKYVLNHRMQYACDILADKKSIKETCYQIGMNDPSHFSKLFKKIIGISPREFLSKLE
jgi:AraC family transcriptional regulator, arabinose operon regulatory protein